MDAAQDKTPLTERKVVRRSLLAGLAGLGAAVATRVIGTSRAQATDGVDLVIGDINQLSQSQTRLRAAPSIAEPALQVVNADAFTFTTAKAAIAGYSDAIGVFATSTGTSAAAVQGNNFSAGPGGIGVSGATDTGTGVRGTATNPTAFGVRGINSINGTGIRGVSNSGLDLVSLGNGSGIGVEGRSGSGPGVQGSSVTSLGVRGLSTNFVGVVGISDTSHGLYGSTSNAGAAGLVGENLSGGVAGFFYGNVQIYGSLQVFGAPKNAIIKMQDGTFASVYCQESPEPYFEDFGRGQLVGGVANVPLEREFATLVAGEEYMVFLTPVGGPAPGLHVSRQNAGSFEVRDPSASSVSFSYRIVTRRKDIEGKRFARVNTDAAQSVAGARAVLAGMRSAGPASGPPVGPPSGPSAPLPPQQVVPPITTNPAPPAPVVPAGPGSTIVPPGARPSSAPGGPSAGR